MIQIPSTEADNRVADPVPFMEITPTNAPIVEQDMETTASDPAHPPT